ncbi:MAG TPA: flagellar export protein FliJ [Candidatus Eubacterium avistercoris]|uniref:Flagellar export protein FliJ n=1 Tax=Candidatus Eubacterium avistercoris TaxID=2838567 RepID=A0A9D2IFY5_9FIRM|nr:flagellar export protein FliJ [Candidatus Eubacterium avistercoris]
MPRGRKSYTLEEQLEITINSIAETEAALKELKQKKKALEAEIKQKNIAELYDMIQQSGKSLDEVKAMLQ